MKSKTINIVKWIATGLVATVILMGAVMKVSMASPLAEIYSRIGLLEYMGALGIVEILLVVLFLYPRTMKIGFLLLTGFYGGAMAIEFSHGSVFIFPAIILALVWIAGGLREPSIFLGGLKDIRYKNQTIG